MTHKPSLIQLNCDTQHIGHMLKLLHDALGDSEVDLALALTRGIITVANRTLDSLAVLVASRTEGVQ